MTPVGMTQVAPLTRVVRVARVQLTTWKQSFGWPLAILGISFGLNIAFFASVGDAVQPTTYGLVSIFIFQTIMASQLVTQGFSFAVGLNVTRRTFFAASGLVLALHSVIFSVLLYLFGALESLTDGWGLQMTYFTVLPITRGYSPLTILVFVVPMLAFSFFGLFFGVVAKRWGTNGVLGLSLLSLVVLAGAVVLITWLDAWPSVGSWLSDQPGLALAAGWTLLPLLALAGGSYGLIRRAVP